VFVRSVWLDWITSWGWFAVLVWEWAPGKNDTIRENAKAMHGMIRRIG
jgi:hypothetical protein